MIPNRISTVAFLSILSALWIQIAMSGCQRESSSPGSNQSVVTDAFKKYTGTYILEPAADRTTLQLENDGVLTMRREGEGVRKGSFQFSPGSLRIFLTLDESTALLTAPLGVFLLSEYDPLGWPGRWDGETRLLVRPAENPPAPGR